MQTQNLLREADTNRSGAHCIALYPTAAQVGGTVLT